MKAKLESTFAYFHPKNWIIVLILSLIRLLVLLPYPFIVKIGELLGHILYQIPSSRSQIALRNIQLCFPNLSSKEQKNLLRKHFISLGIGFIEVGIARWKSTKKLKQIVQVQGLENLRDAVAKNKGVILFSAHFTLLEISALIGRNDIGMGLPPLVGMFRLGNNPLINRFFRNTRLRSCESLVTKNEVKDLIRALKNKKIVWYAADQSFIGKNAIPVKFFGHEAMTNAGITRIAEIAGCPVLPFLPSRLPDGEGYILEIYPEIDAFPSDNPQQDMERMHRILEAHILKNPEQYYWVHRRFKGSASGWDPYVKEN
jgi:KDO2-lipid IV(A) lauroyltransferase